ncbi:hypothetical protein F441_01396 [Phytophthora nicotianae CJ01A1]|uniref:DUF676 domain-containing protein n=2 Tax=Phytophthora nicotianae TaxID=4792 RepID=W2HMQ1_PHYNI|nr:hypothetical protein L915_01339 [Phytophthora nicotianae]ETL49150.1 hypothetical protein L916_01314 [Phytophthora nicotianae]ETP25756.1 hypothetical protein F441_01396 [Phytophthora nicotianae CJ01A1]
MSTLHRSAIVAVVFTACLAFAAAQNSVVQDDTTANWPSLNFQFLIKRAATEVHGQSEFSVLANPIVSSDNSSVFYNSFTSFEEDGMLYNYSLVDGVAYVSHSFMDDSENPQVQCMDTNILPPVNAIVAALSDAEAVSTILTSKGKAISCLSGNSFKTSVHGIEFGLCFSGSSGFTMYGSDMDIKVEYVENHTPILAPNVDKSAEIHCEKVASPTTVTSLGKSFLTGEQISADTRNLKAAFDLFSMDDTCSCKSEPRPCVFIHGLGVLVEEEENLDTYDYWGNMTGHTPCCSTTKYAVLNTVNNSWTDHIQQQKVCDHILAVSETSKGTKVSDTIIVSHSMGGLMVAGAIANGLCSLDKSTTWVSTGSPITGSMASDYFQESCKDQTNVFMERFVETTGFCPADDGIKSLAYIHEGYSNPVLDVAYEAAQKAYRENVYALMCSNSYSGILSSYQVGFWVLGSVVSHKSRKNDGMVEFHSCAGGFPASKFGNDYRDRFYASKLNHYDVAFKGGDALLDKTKMPVKWFECLL